jgi:two-component system phosphate regulon sensor histidine kinase PhoR
VINTEADRLNRLITDLLYLSQLETGLVEVVKKPVDAQKVIDKTINLLRPVAENRNVTIKGEILPGAETFKANQDMIEQVIINLMENAIKYSYKGGEVKIVVKPHEEGVDISVTDQGIGIPAESLSRIFERFYRVDKARSRQVGGTGLGLSIVKHIVERHRGKVLVESEEKKGSTISVILPKN